MKLSEKDISKLANDHPDNAPAEWHEVVGLLWKFVDGKLLAPDRLRYAAGLADKLAHGGLIEAQAVTELEPQTALVSPNAALILTRAAHILEAAADAPGPQQPAAKKKAGPGRGKLYFAQDLKRAADIMQRCRSVDTVAKEMKLKRAVVLRMLDAYRQQQKRRQ